MKVSRSQGVHKMTKLVNTKQPKGMMELFSKQGVSVPVTTQMVWEAYQHVKQGGEAPGIDGMTWEYLYTHRSRLLYQLWVRLASGSYFPKAIRAVSIPKKDGNKRVLGLPTLLDRIAQQVVRVHLEKILEPHFHQNSYGYRVGKRMHDALHRAKFNCSQYPYVITLDIKSYFDTIPHDALLKCLDVHFVSHPPDLVALDKLGDL